MSEEKNWQTLYDKYPNLFENRHKTPMQSCLSFGIECNSGWYEILASLCWMIRQHEDNKVWRKKYLEENDPEKLKQEPEYFSVKFDQIKEKFGGLRIYYSGGDDYVRGLVNLAEAMSYKICEICGNKGKPNKNGWISTLCDAHRESLKNNLDNDDNADILEVL